MFLQILKPKFARRKHDGPLSPKMPGRCVSLVSDSSSTDDSSVFDAVSRSPGTPLTILDAYSFSSEKKAFHEVYKQSDIESIAPCSPKSPVTKPSSCYRTPPLPQEGLENDTVDTSVEVSLSDSPSHKRDSGLFRRVSFKLSRNGLAKRPVSEKPLTSLAPAVQISSSPRTPSKQRKSVDTSQLDSVADDIEIPKRSPLRLTAPHERYSSGTKFGHEAVHPATGTKAPHVPVSVPRKASLVSSSQLPKISNVESGYKPALQGLDSALLKQRPSRVASNNLVVSGDKSTVTGRRVSSSVPKLNSLENLLKVKIFIGDVNQEVVALKLKKDRLSDINELIDVITFRAICKDSGLSNEQVKIDMFFPDLRLKPIVIKGTGAHATFGSSTNDLLMDYVMAKEKVYVRAYV